MEDYLLSLQLRGKKFAVCELGNYFGQEETFGAATLIEAVLVKLGWEKAGLSLSLDTIPNIDYNQLDLWITPYRNFHK